MSPISASPRGMTTRATLSPTRKIPYKPAALASPSAISLGPIRRRRASRSAAIASPPRTSPVAVMRSQKRARGPRNVRPNAANAAPMPSARSFTSSARDECRDDEPHDQEVSENSVELGGLEVDHRDRALLAGRAELRRADLPDEERQRKHREQRPGREQPDDDGRRERQVPTHHQRDIEPVRRGASCLHRER